MCDSWPYAVDFTKRITNLAEYKYLYGVHYYSLKDYAKAKKFFFSAVLIDPNYKLYTGYYLEYLITQER